MNKFKPGDIVTPINNKKLRMTNRQDRPESLQLGQCAKVVDTSNFSLSGQIVIIEGRSAEDSKDIRIATKLERALL